MKIQRQFIIFLCILIINQLVLCISPRFSSYLSDKNKQEESESIDNACAKELTPERCDFFARIQNGDHMEDINTSESIPHDYTMPDGTSPVRHAIRHKNTHAIVNLINAGYEVSARDYHTIKAIYNTQKPNTYNPLKLAQYTGSKLHEHILCYFIYRQLNPDLLTTKNGPIDFNSRQAQLITAAQHDDVLKVWDILEQKDIDPNTTFLGSEALYTALSNQSCNASTLLLEDPRVQVRPEHQLTLYARANILESNVKQDAIARDDYPGNAQRGTNAQRFDQDLTELRYLESLVMQRLQQQSPEIAWHSKLDPIIAQRQAQAQAQAQQNFLMRIHQARANHNRRQTLPATRRVLPPINAQQPGLIQNLNIPLDQARQQIAVQRQAEIERRRQSYPNAPLNPIEQTAPLNRRQQNKQSRNNDDDDEL